MRITSHVKQQFLKVAKGFDLVLSYILGSFVFFALIIPVSFVIKIYKALTSKKASVTENVKSFWVEPIGTKKIDSLKKRY